MRDISILEAADDMRDGVRLTDMREELISQPLALGRARYEAGDIDETSECRCRFLRLEHLRQIIDAMIRDLYAPTFGSMVQKGKFAASAPAFVMALNSVLFPTFGSPTMPICRFVLMDTPCKYRFRDQK